jgi:hypothetical protein
MLPVKLLAAGVRPHRRTEVHSRTHNSCRTRCASRALQVTTRANTMSRATKTTISPGTRPYLADERAGPPGATPPPSLSHFPLKRTILSRSFERASTRIAPDEPPRKAQQYHEASDAPSFERAGGYSGEVSVSDGLLHIEANMGCFKTHPTVRPAHAPSRVDLLKRDRIIGVSVAQAVVEAQRRGSNLPTAAEARAAGYSEAEMVEAGLGAAARGVTMGPGEDAHVVQPRVLHALLDSDADGHPQFEWAPRG